MNIKKIFFVISLCICTLVCFSIVASAETGYVTADVLKVRATTSTTATVIGRVSGGTALELLAYDGLWYKVRLNDGTEGYVSASYITLTPPGAEVSYFGYVNATSLKVHSSTGVNTPVIGRLISGTSVELLAFDGAWYHIRSADGIDGYVSAEFITPSSAEVAQAQQNSQSSYGYVIADVLKIHSSTGIATTVTGKLSRDERVELLAYDGSWFKVRTSAGIEGYVSAAYISFTQGGEPTVSFGYVDATILNVRELPGTATNIVSKLVMGTRIELLTYDGAWYQVKTPEGILGYASADYISLSPIEVTDITAAENSVIVSESHGNPSAASLSLGEQIIATAKTYMGIPYVYGAAGPDSFDCSGFTMYVMNKNGVKLPHQSGQQYTYGFEVAMDELVAGDLVFFNTSRNSGVGHVGIYIGNNQFIHASSGSAHAVTISSLSEDYYSAHYVGARRVI